ncbi:MULTISPECIES: hypothetical protein [Klebsiella pneumoniae complex]|uniref:hypothetical protein n=1 Tax=Klebsiella TaxID=570 RepID=UPI001CF6F41E|nr:hypothetical protein [Klebsiella pneumoniae]MCB4111054.1 hypothetical protein [Klebsiella pneumoniae]MCB4128988.1 hypothetical protein [Klebsiella pneumoniae]MCM2147028.1 hypothetical protein [Klebsiella pneumoniae]MCM2226859.1 hypothetical protein [Klebsiella pneumoniae]MDS7711899.1 hypothetical protein [Klebsiella pneumoniae]
MSTNKHLLPPMVQKKDDVRDRIRAAFEEATARTSELVYGKVIIIDDEFVKVFRLDDERAPRNVGLHRFHNREGMEKSTRARLQLKGLSPWVARKPTVVSQLEMDKEVLLNLLKYRDSIKGNVLVAKGSSYVKKPVYSKLPSMTREQVISLSDRMYARTLEEMRRELYDDAE